MYGSNEKLLRVNLSTGILRWKQSRKIFTGFTRAAKALAGYILLNEIPAHTEPFSPENVLVIANGLLTGAPGLHRHSLYRLGALTADQRLR